MENQNTFWLNLSSKDLSRAKKFYEALPGFEINEKHSDTNMLGLFVGEGKVVVNFFSEKVFSGYTQSPITDLGKSSEVLMSIGASNKDEVDNLAKIILEVGGKLLSAPSEINGWMYGANFSDPDGHKWNVLYMNMNKMPQRNL